MVTTDGRSKVMQDPKAETLCSGGWLPSPFNDVNDDPSPLNEEQCVIMLGDNEASFSAVQSVAAVYHDKAGKDVDSMPIKFFSGKSGGVTGQIRKLTSVTDNKLILLDIPDDGAFYVLDLEEDKISPAAVNQFIEDVQAKKVTRQNLTK